MPMKKILVILLSVFAFVACSKDDNVPFVDSIAELHNTYWRSYGFVHMAVYDDNGTLIKEIPDDSGTPYSGTIATYIYLANDKFCTFFERLGSASAITPHFVYTEDSVVYNPTARILKAGETIYELLEFSNTQLKLRYKVEEDSKTYVYTKIYEPWSGPGMSWSEWVDYMEAENAKMK